MHLLILGHSSIVRRRVLPAARAIASIHRISIASRRPPPPDAAANPGWFTDYDDALAASGADIVYVSGINSAHTEWAARALEAGMHVIVDKPAFPDVVSAEAMVALARRRQRGLAEATVFGFHPQVAALRSLVPDGERRGSRATMIFSIPPLPPHDFRYRGDCGGGSLYDLGPYVVATNRLLFGSAPASVHCEVLARGPQVDMSFGTLLTHADGGALVGHCGFDTAYQNRLSVLTRSHAIDIERFFTTPPDFQVAVTITGQDTRRVVNVPAADAFVLFLQAFCDAVGRADFAGFENALLEDARLLEGLRRAAGRA